VDWFQAAGVPLVSDAREVPPTAVTHGHEAGKVLLKSKLLVPFPIPGRRVEGSRHCESWSATPQSPVAATTLTPCKPSLRNSRHCCSR